MGPINKIPRGYFGIGCVGMKTSMNYGTLFRSANHMGADFIFLIGCRFKAQASDTVKTHRRLPLFVYDTPEDFMSSGIPHGCQLIGIELTDRAVPLQEFKHPERAIYLLGPEDGSIRGDLLDKCVRVVEIPSNDCLNVSVAGSIVMYDRIAKQAKEQ